MKHCKEKYKGFTGLPSQEDPEFEEKMKKGNKGHEFNRFHKSTGYNAKCVCDSDYHGKPYKCGSDSY